MVLREFSECVSTIVMNDNVKDLDKEQLMTIIMQTDICMVLINDMVKKNYYDDDKFSCVISDLLCNESGSKSSDYNYWAGTT